ncbi:unnamed protein product [Larinioides sclopetarius]|uniref:Uncharacterized protein n=1 Tax=Larinioides sclopetarius TaxID=280406 RepID=A0AAV1ZL18_9ARAC
MSSHIGYKYGKETDDPLLTPDIGNKQRDLYIIWLKMKGNIGIFSTRVDQKGLKFDLATWRQAA